LLAAFVIISRYHDARIHKRQNQKELEYVEYFSYFGSNITNDMKLNPVLPWKKQHSTRRKQFSPGNLT